MSFRRLVTLFDYTKAGYWAQIKCLACGHRRQIDPMKLLDRAMKRELPTQPERLAPHMPCKNCGANECRTTHCQGPMVRSDGKPLTAKAEKPFEPPRSG